ncbi:MAG: tripartite tricarboxylate transporter substrate binding protein [Acetobacteraceae bacterium]|nr:tripartite tricarboxylate transporter substrate binding protein [Acetobacteraceae bacterium]
MRITRRGALAAALAAPSLAAAETGWPTRPVRVVVPFAAGGGTDVAARVYVARMSELLGQPLVIDNRGGSGGNIGAELVVRAPPDGYTILLTSNGPSTVNRFLYKDMAFDPARDLVPVGQIFRIEQLLVVTPSLPANTVGEFIALARARPGEITTGSGGNGSSLHLALELFKLRAGVNLVHVPYRGGGPAMIDLTAGTIHSMFDSMPSALPQVRAGRVRALGMCGTRRHPLLPGVPTIAEAGVPGYDAGTWIALFAPVGTPPAIVQRLSEVSAAALAEPGLGEALGRVGTDAASSTPRQLAERMARETAVWAEVVREAGIVAN